MVKENGLGISRVCFSSQVRTMVEVRIQPVGTRGEPGGGPLHQTTCLLLAFARAPAGPCLPHSCTAFQHALPTMLKACVWSDGRTHGPCAEWFLLRWTWARVMQASGTRSIPCGLRGKQLPCRSEGINCGCRGKGGKAEVGATPISDLLCP